ncbi:uncharacterized protein LOC135445421 [Zonotrichia leucophrys gambelii]|uniref:uncharacterized protein LOC135445421 n=1 Tax=Zonotrichia leucophrys gambelii TaxID=257770 RepID=UPI003140A414
MAETIADTRRLISKPQNLNDAYGPPSNFLEIDVGNPQTVGVGRGRFTTYEIRVKVSRPGSGVAVSGSRVARRWPGWRCRAPAAVSFRTGVTAAAVRGAGGRWQSRSGLSILGLGLITL